MRIGEAPVRVKRSHVRPAPVTVCIVSCIPHQLDYYAHRLDVLRLCLDSLRAHTPRDAYELMVLDNGSGAAAVDELRARQRAGDIDHLHLSTRNIGKINGCRMLFDAAPGELIAYADDDVWFGPGWLDAQLEILSAFPRVGMVSARPVRKQFLYGNTGLVQYLEAFPQVSRTAGQLIPDEWEREYLRSTGRPEEPCSVDDVKLECAGVCAYATATHFQFVAPKAAIVAALAKRDQPRTGSEERQFEEAIEAAGLVRLSTTGRHVRHIGNVVSDELRAAAAESMTVTASPWRAPSPWWIRLARTRVVRAVCARINRWTFAVLNHP